MLISKKISCAVCTAGLVFAGLIPSMAKADILIGPRFAYYFDNSNLRTSAIPSGEQDEQLLVDIDQIETLQLGLPNQVSFTAQQDGIGVVADQIIVPMIGAIVNFGDDRDRFTISGLYGQGDGSFASTQAVSRSLTIGEVTAVDFGQLISTAEFEYDRLDIEATWQRRTSERFAFFAGLRYERLERNGPGTSSQAITFNVPNLGSQAIADLLGQTPQPVLEDVIPEAFPSIESASQDVFSIRAGATAFVPLSDSATAFFNGVVHASYQPSFVATSVFPDVNGPGQDLAIELVQSDEFSAGPDVSVGAQVALAENIALDMRYRAVIFFPVSGASSFGDARVNHGINIGVSIRL